MNTVLPMAIACLLCAPPVVRQPTGKADIFSFDRRADQLLKEFFPRKVRISGITRAFQDRGKQPRFENLDAVFEYHSQAVDQVKGGSEWWEVHDDTMESAWVGVPRAEGWQRPMLQRADHVAVLAKGLAVPARPFAGPLEKALFQRDLLQICMIFQEAISAENDARIRAPAERAVKELVSLWRRQWLTESEFKQLAELRPGQATPGRFTAVNRFDLSKDYLPARILGAEKNWYAMPFGKQASLHYRAFAGRSFVRIYLKPPGWTQAQFFQYWDGVADKFGARVTQDGRVPPLPAGTETLLVRSFAVFLHDGSCADSGFPEEVLMRLIKHTDTRLDLATSDYRGTLAYRYEMRRRDLLAGVGSMGLRRVPDDEPQFFGFFSDVPDRRRTSSANLTTMRNNCVSCHSEAFYGASTVYSLGQQRRGRPGHEKLEGGLLEPTATPGRFHLHTPEFTALRPLLPKE